MIDGMVAGDVTEEEELGPYPSMVADLGLVLELNFDDTFVKPYHLELYHKPIQEFYMIKTSQGELIIMCIVIVDSMLKALKHSHIIVY